MPSDSPHYLFVEPAVAHTLAVVACVVDSTEVAQAVDSTEAVADSIVVVEHTLCFVGIAAVAGIVEAG